MRADHGAGGDAGATVQHRAGQQGRVGLDDLAAATPAALRNWAAAYRAAGQRSLSVGDAVTVATPDGQVLLQVLGSGFGVLPDVTPSARTWSVKAQQARFAGVR